MENADGLPSLTLRRRSRDPEGDTAPGSRRFGLQTAGGRGCLAQASPRLQRRPARGAPRPAPLMAQGLRSLAQGFPRPALRRAQRFRRPAWGPRRLALRQALGLRCQTRGARGPELQTTPGLRSPARGLGVQGWEQLGSLSSQRRSSDAQSWDTVLCAAPVAAVTARGFQGVACTGRFSDPPLASKNNPRGQGRAPPPAPAGRTPAPPWPRPRGGGAQARHRISATGAPQVSSGHQTSWKSASLDPASYLGGQSGCRVHSLGATWVPFRPHAPGIAWRLGPSCAPGWPSGGDVPRSHLSEALPAPPSRRVATPRASGLSPTRPTPAAHSSGWRGSQGPP